MHGSHFVQYFVKLCIHLPPKYLWMFKINGMKWSKMYLVLKVYMWCDVPGRGGIKPLDTREQVPYEGPASGQQWTEMQASKQRSRGQEQEKVIQLMQIRRTWKSRARVVSKNQANSSWPKDPKEGPRQTTETEARGANPGTEEMHWPSLSCFILLSFWWQQGLCDPSLEICHWLI